MSKILNISKDNKYQTMHDSYQELKNDVKLDLNKPMKQISTKYLYDEHGSELFNQITRHSDYYLTRVELEILTTYKKDISDQISDAPFNLIELGPGEGIKTEVLLGEFLRNLDSFSYIPIDISTQYLKKFLNRLNHQLPTLNATGIHADYFKGMEWISKHSDQRNVVLFFGSSIGNFDPLATKEFLDHLHDTLHKGDFVLIGFDLCKNPNVLMQAYNDTEGLTREFNLNLLQRLNRELGANFDLNKFQHYPTYTVYTGAMESYLVSLEKQKIYIDALDQSFEFDAIEPIHVEFSYKYKESQIESLADKTGFKIVKNFFDSHHYFVDSLWCVEK